MMRVTLLHLEKGQGQREVTIEISGRYHPEHLEDICHRAVETFNDEFAEGEVVEIEFEGVENVDGEAGSSE